MEESHSSTSVTFQTSVLRKLSLSPKTRRTTHVSEFIDDKAKDVDTPQVRSDLHLSDSDSNSDSEADEADEAAVAEDDANFPTEPEDHFELGQDLDSESPDIEYTNTQVRVIESASTAPPKPSLTLSKSKYRIPKRQKVITPEFLNDDVESDDFVEPPKAKRRRDNKGSSAMAASLAMSGDMDDFPIIRDMDCRSWNKKRKLCVCKTIDYFLAHETLSTPEEYTDKLFTTLYLGCENEQVFINLRNAIMRKAEAKCRGNWLSPDPMKKVEPKRLSDFIDMIKLCQMNDQWEELAYKMFKIMHTSDHEILTKALTDDD